MSTEPVTQKVGFYGKIPSHGDFVRHLLPRSFIEPWDNWLQASLFESKKSLGENWLDTYLTSPIYRFVITAGICGNHQWMGVFMPSVDSVGRYFPFTLCVPVSNTKNSFNLMEEYHDWFERAEAEIVTCLNDEFDYDQFISVVETMTIMNQSSVEFETISLSEIANGNPVLVKSDLAVTDDISSCLPDILDQVLCQTSFAYSVWMTKGSDDIPANIITSQGLPLSQYYSSLISGNWKGQKEGVILPTTND